MGKKILIFSFFLFFLFVECSNYSSIINPLEFRNYFYKETYIVGFFQYQSVFTHLSSLSRVLGISKSSTWSHIPRNNPAFLLYPTDFLIITFHNPYGSLLSQFFFQYITYAPNNTEFKYFQPHHEYTFSKSFKHFRNILNFSPRFDSKIDISSENDDVIFPDSPISYCPTQRNLLFYQDDNGASKIDKLLQISNIWSKGYTGKGVKIGIFDTGLAEQNPYIKNIKDRSNWTNEKYIDDILGHGTFMAGVIASTNPECRGLAYDAEIYSFRIFTKQQTSYTSWFLDAFNYAIHSRLDIINLSIGGPDYLDKPFIDKVRELTANNIILVSAIGNDGPLYGTLNNPADMMEVIGVGGLTNDNTIATYSSRGISTWELPSGYGRVKPDIVTYSHHLKSLKLETSHISLSSLASYSQGNGISDGCRVLSGTSTASPVVTGSIAILANIMFSLKKQKFYNIASIKQILTYTANRLSSTNIFEQGAGRMNLVKAVEYLENQFQPHVSSFPSTLYLDDCPYMWPWCSQPIYANSLPLILNLTLYNSLLVYSELKKVEFIPSTNGHLINVEFDYPPFYWPYVGYLAVFITVPSQYSVLDITSPILVSGTIHVNLGLYNQIDSDSSIDIPLRVNVINTPPRQSRLLWDQFHNLFYPSGYFPRDNLENKDDVLDWHGDHIHTNFRQLYNTLREHNYYIEVLGRDYTCFDSSQYGVLLIIDPEEEFFEIEVMKLYSDITLNGLSVIIFADWYNLLSISQLPFFDANTNSWWYPETGGSNIPALNDLLSPYGIKFGGETYSGDVILPASLSYQNSQYSFHYGSGNSIIQFPSHGYLFSSLLHSSHSNSYKMVPILGIHTPPTLSTSSSRVGRIIVFGDSNCLDQNHQINNCYSFFLKLLEIATLPSSPIGLSPLEKDFKSDNTNPSRYLNNYHQISKVVCDHCHVQCLNKYSKEIIEGWNETFSRFSLSPISSPSLSNNAELADINHLKNMELQEQYAFNKIFFYSFLLFSLLLLSLILFNLYRISFK